MKKYYINFKIELSIKLRERSLLVKNDTYLLFFKLILKNYFRLSLSTKYIDVLLYFSYQHEKQIFHDNKYLFFLYQEINISS